MACGPGEFGRIEACADRAVADGVHCEADGAILACAESGCDLVGGEERRAAAAVGGRIGEIVQHPGGLAVEGAVGEEFGTQQGKAGALPPRGRCEVGVEFGVGGEEADAHAKFAAVVQFGERGPEPERAQQVVDLGAAERGEVREGGTHVIEVLARPWLGRAFPDHVCRAFEQKPIGFAVGARQMTPPSGSRVEREMSARVRAVVLAASAW